MQWVVYAKCPFAGPAAVLANLSRYTHRVAISNRRLVASCHWHGAVVVKGCPTPARTKRLTAAQRGLRAGVGQASREETAGRTAVVGTG
jgi:putative transposase